MPWTMGAFSVAALGMIGIPPTAGFISKWYLATGSVQDDRPWIIVVLLMSTALNAMYYLPILYRAWLVPAETGWHEQRPHLRTETSLALLIPSLCTALLLVAVGVLASAPFSPLAWAELIVAREYAP
jgi:multicomponent Na+:H+ antiporter subunit D